MSFKPGDVVTFRYSISLRKCGDARSLYVEGCEGQVTKGDGALLLSTEEHSIAIADCCVLTRSGIVGWAFSGCFEQ